MVSSAAPPDHDTGAAWRLHASRVPAGPLIGGEEEAGTEVLEVRDPSSDECFATVGAGGAATMVDAVAAAHGAGPAWAATAPRARAEVLRRAHDAMLDEAEAIATVIVLENGKSFADALAEVHYAASYLLWNAELAAHLGGHHALAPGGDKHILTNRQPVGVCLLVTPWNFPAAMATRKLAPALAAGCTTVLKPAELTPLTALWIGRILTEAGAPAGVVNVVPTVDAPSAVAAALADDRVRKLSFTGSTPVGATLLRAAGERVVNCSMELGGNAPFVVLDDADLDLAVQGAVVAKMRNGGQACTAANRFHVHEALLPAFTDRLAARLGALRVGAGLADGTDVGPLVSGSARDKVERLVQAAVDEGATVVTGGARVAGAGHYYAPTVLADVAPGDAILAEEVFGPVAPIVAFGDDDQALAQANDSPHGLASYVFTADLSRGLAFAERLEAGMVGLNRGIVSDAAAPFGGVKQSGLGREGAVEGIDAYLETQYVAVSW